MNLDYHIKLSLKKIKELDMTSSVATSMSSFLKSSA